MEKIVVLNSGGFDSVTLIHYLKYILLGDIETDIHSLHFLYGAPNERQQKECVDKVCNKIQCTNKVIELPKFDWTSNDYYKEGPSDLEGHYLEYRNLIFTSYAISYAQSIGANTVYLAILNQGDYPDATIDFLAGINRISEQSGIRVFAPFVDKNKFHVYHLAHYFGIKEGDYFSCDSPDATGHPCGMCEDCKTIEQIRKEFDSSQFQCIFDKKFS